MKYSIYIIFISMAITFAASSPCFGQSDAAKAPVNFANPQIYNGPDQCNNIWAEIILGGKVRNFTHGKSSLWEIRDAVKNDDTSIFSKIIKKVWSLQGPVDRSHENYGHWPVSINEENNAVWMPNKKIYKYLATIMPSECFVFTDFRDQLWDSMLFRYHGNNMACSPVYTDMPKEVIDNPKRFSAWMIYWLLVRIDGPINKILTRPRPEMACFENGKISMLPLE